MGSDHIIIEEEVPLDKVLQAAEKVARWAIESQGIKLSYSQDELREKIREYIAETWEDLFARIEEFVFIEREQNIETATSLMMYVFEKVIETNLRLTLLETINQATSYLPAMMLKHFGEKKEAVKQALPTSEELNENHVYFTNSSQNMMPKRGKGGSKSDVPVQTRVRYAKTVDRLYERYREAKKTYKILEKNVMPEPGRTNTHARRLVVSDSVFKQFRKEYPQFNDLPDEFVKRFPQAIYGEVKRLAHEHAAVLCGLASYQYRNLQTFSKEGRSIARTLSSLAKKK